MRIILLLAAAAGAAAIATAAAAQPAARSAGHGAGTPGAWAPTRGHRAGTGWQGSSRPGMSRGHDRRHGRHRGRFGGSEGHGLFFDGGFGIAGWYGAGGPYGDGFFADGGGEVRMRGGRPYYDYDRSYPYEWAPGAGGRPEQAEGTRSAGPPARCALESGVRVCRGW